MSQVVLERTPVLRSARGRSGIIALVQVAVFAQIARNWLMLQAVGVDGVGVRRPGGADRDGDAEPAPGRP
jgi:hypothetical protein